jgi:hypothetical protein
LSKEGIQPGDRRQFKSVGAAQAFAYLSGAECVEPEHLEILASTLEALTKRGRWYAFRISSLVGIRMSSRRCCHGQAARLR